MNKKIFNNEALQASLSQSQSTLAELQKSMNSMSEDIKKLEAYLRGTSLDEEFCYTLPPGPDFEPIGEYAGSAEMFGDGLSAEGIMVVKQLIWDIVKKRLMYVRSEAPAYYDTNNLEFGYSIFAPTGDFKETLRRPLIETPLVVRRAVFGYLPDFLESIAKKYNPNVDTDEKVLF